MHGLNRFSLQVFRHKEQWKWPRIGWNDFGLSWFPVPVKGLGADFECRESACGSLLTFLSALQNSLRRQVELSWFRPSLPSWTDGDRLALRSEDKGHK